MATRPLLPQHDGAARIVAHGVERVLADIDADHQRSRYWVSETWRAPCLWRPLPASLAGGAGARPDHPISGPQKKKPRTLGACPAKSRTDRFVGYFCSRYATRPNSPPYRAAAVLPKAASDILARGGRQCLRYIAVVSPLMRIFVTQVLLNAPDRFIAKVDGLDGL